MDKVNLTEAKANLSKIVADVMSTGVPVIISKNGSEAVQVSRISNKSYDASKRPLGLLAGKATLPDDFDSMFSEEIESMFKGMF